MRGLDDSKYLFLRVSHQKEENNLPLRNVFWGPTSVKGLLNILLRPFNIQGGKKGIGGFWIWQKWEVEEGKDVSERARLQSS